MRDPGYSDSFLVFMTAKMGIQFVAGTDNGRMMSRLLSREMTASELANNLGLPLSTVQSRLDSLVSRNLLEYSGGAGQGKRRRYRNCASLMFHNCNGSSWYYTSKDQLIKDMMSKNSNHYFLIISTLLSIQADLGLDFWPMIPESGSSLSAMSKMEKDVHLDKYYKNTREFRTEYLPNSVLSISAKDSLEIEVISEDRGSYNNTVYLGFLAGIFRTILPEMTGHNYNQVIHVERNEQKNAYKLHSARFIGEPFQDNLTDIFKRDLAVKQPFRIYRIRDRPFIIYNETMLEILSILSERDVPSSVMISLLGCPVSTAYHFLDRLEKLGAIKTVGTRNRIHSLACECIIGWNEPKIVSLDRTRELFECENGPRDIPLIIFTYLAEIVGCSGIAIDYSIRKLAEYIVERTYPYFLHMSFSEYIEEICSHYPTVSSVVWKSPIEAEIRCGNDCFSTHSEMKILNEVLVCAKKILPGNNISISFAYASGRS